MKIAVVPAQVTTVEDRIAGRFGLSQVLLLATPVFIGSALYMLLPPPFHDAIYKLYIVGLLILICGMLAIRIKGKILLFWLVTVMRFNLRPRYYVCDRRTLTGRGQYARRLSAELKEEANESPKNAKSTLLPTAEIIKVEGMLSNPAINVGFRHKKGGLYVRITEIKSQD